MQTALSKTTSELMGRPSGLPLHPALLLSVCHTANTFHMWQHPCIYTLGGQMLIKTSGPFTCLHYCYLLDSR